MIERKCKGLSLLLILRTNNFIIGCIFVSFSRLMLIREATVGEAG